jgi:hypothetical protein
MTRPDERRPDLDKLRDVILQDQAGSQRGTTRHGRDPLA